MDLELVGGVGAVGLIVALVQLVKNLGLNGRFAGVLALLLGLFVSWGAHLSQDVTWFHVVIIGLSIGLTASGAWSTGKSVSELVGGKRGSGHV